MTDSTVSQLPESTPPDRLHSAGSPPPYEAAGAAVCLVLGLYSLSVDGHRILSFAILGVAAVCGALAATRVALPGAAARVPPLALAIAVSLSASLLTAQLSNRGPSPDIEVTPIVLWSAAILLLLSAICISAIRAHGGRFTVDAWRLRGEVGLVSLITVGAFLVRVVDLTSLPTPFSGDEAAFVMQAERVGHLEIRNVFESGYQGHPNAFWWTLYGFIQVFGDSVWGARFYGVVVGTAAVPIVYVLLRSLFTRGVAITGALYLAAYHFAVNYSRQDMNNIADTVTVSLVAFFLWRAVSHQRAYDYTAAGLLGGLGFYMYAGARAVIPIIGLVLLCTLVLNRARSRQILAGSAYLGAALVTALAPLGLYWIENPDQFMDRLRQIGIYQSGWLTAEIAKTGKNEISILIEQAKMAFGAFGYYSDLSPFYRSPMPLVDHASLPFFLIGLTVAAARFYQPRYFILLAIFVVVVGTGGVLTVQPPQSQRFLGTVPVVVGFIAVGANTVAGSLVRIRPRLPSGFIAGALIAALAVYNVYYYFVPYQDGEYYSDFNTRIADRAAGYVTALPQETSVFWQGAPSIFAGHPTLRWPTRDRTIYDVLHDGRILPLPYDLDAPTAVLALQGRQDFDKVVEACPGGSAETIKDRRGRTLFRAYRTDDARCVAAVLLALAPIP